MSTALAIEAYNNDLNVNWEDTSILRNVKNVRHAYIAEALEIDIGHRKERLLNMRCNLCDYLLKSSYL